MSEPTIRPPAPHGASPDGPVGGAEAPLCADVIEGLSTMGALGTDQALLELCVVALDQQILRRFGEVYDALKREKWKHHNKHSRRQG